MNFLAWGISSLAERSRDGGAGEPEGEKSVEAGCLFWEGMLSWWWWKADLLPVFIPKRKKDETYYYTIMCFVLHCIFVLHWFFYFVLWCTGFICIMLHWFFCLFFLHWFFLFCFTLVCQVLYCIYSLFCFTFLSLFFFKQLLYLSHGE